MKATPYTETGMSAPVYRSPGKYRRRIRRLHPPRRDRYSQPLCIQVASTHAPGGSTRRTSYVDRAIVV